MKKVYILIILVALIVGGYQSYAYYVATMNVSVTSTASNIKCDAEIQSVSSSEQSIYGYSEFKVVVKNTENNVLTAEPFNYTITIDNLNSSNAIYGYNNAFDANLVINGSLSNDQARTNSHIIQVKSNSGLSENIEYRVNVNCVQ